MKEPQIFRMQSKRDIRSAKVDEVYAHDNGCICAWDVNASTKSVKVTVAALGREWMDFLSMTSSGSPLLCSERVLNSIQNEKLTGYHAVPVSFLPPKGKKMAVPWNYYWLMPWGLPIEIRNFVYQYEQKKWHFKFESKEGYDDPRISELRKELEHWQVSERRAHQMASWDGSDFISWGRGVKITGVFGTMSCSRRVLDLAAHEKWTNIEFNLIDTVMGRTINHLGPWPPEKWYADSEPNWQDYPETQQARAD